MSNLTDVNLNYVIAVESRGRLLGVSVAALWPLPFGSDCEVRQERTGSRANNWVRTTSVHAVERHGLPGEAGSDAGSNVKDREGALMALLQVMSRVDGPLGTRNTRTSLTELGFDLSESSVSRLLREADARKWTVRVGSKGRILSPEGRRRAADEVLSRRAAESLSEAVGVRDVKDLLDLLRARKAVESALAGDAARTPDPRDTEELYELLAVHRGAVGGSEMRSQPGLTLHRKIASMATNRTLSILADLVLAPHLDRVEAVLDIILGSRYAESSVVDEHAAVVDAIAAGDPEAAERVMNQHFENMIGQAESYIVGGNESMVVRLLDWMDGMGYGGNDA